MKHEIYRDYQQGMDIACLASRYNLTCSEARELLGVEVCVHCGEDTQLGSGRFVNRIPHDDDWLCSDCLFEIEENKDDI
jgi:hypothetical protein